MWLGDIRIGAATKAVLGRGKAVRWARCGGCVLAVASGGAFTGLGANAK